MRDTQAIRADLLQRLDRLLGRQSAITHDRHQVKGPLPADWEEQATALENAEVLDGLDTGVREEITRLRAALGRLEAGTWGVCAACGEEIPEGRLKALPWATTCVACAR